MSDYYIQSINKTFFLSGSFIYHTNNSGSNADKSNGTLINRDFLVEKLSISNNDVYTITIKEFIDMTNEVSGSKSYFNDKEVF